MLVGPNDPDTEALKHEITYLKEKVGELEAKITELTTVPIAVGVVSDSYFLLILKSAEVERMVAE